MSKNKTCGVYKITNLTNGKVYIGQSIKIEERWKEHIREAFKEDSEKYNYPLYLAIRKHGLENFTFEILEECLPECLGEKEKHYISLYDSFPATNGKGYNLNPGGSGGFPYKNKNFKDKITLNLIKYYLLSPNLKQKEIAKMLDVCESTVSCVNKGKLAFDPNLEYPLRYNNSTSNLNYNKFKASQKRLKKQTCLVCGSEINRKSKCCKKCKSIFYKKHNYTKNSNYKPGVKIAPPKKLQLLENFYIFLNCSKVADKYNISTMLLYKWRKELNLPDNIKDTINLYEKEYLGVVREEKPKRQIRKVLQISLENGEILREFNNCNEAALALGKEKISSSKVKGADSINRCCNNKLKTAYGYIWKYKE